MVSKKQLRIGIIGTIALILLVPLCAMQFTNDVNWSIQDFAIAAVILLALGFLIGFIMHSVKSINTRIVFILLILAVFVLIWIELAVGIFGTPLSGS